MLSSYWKKIKNNKEGRTVFANFSYLSLLQLAGYGFPLITMPYLARVLGAEGFGKIAFASAVIVWAQTIADWGFNLTATRDVAQNIKNKEVVSQIFSNVLWSRLLLSIFAGFILIISIIFIPLFRDNSTILFVTFLLVPGQVLFPDWFFQAIEKMKYTTIFNLLLKLLFTIAVFIFIHDRDDYIIQPLLTTLGYISCGLGALYLIIGKWGYKIYKPQWKIVFNTIFHSTDVFINNLMPNLYNSFSVMLLGFFGGSFANGIYDGANKFPNIFYNLQSVLSRAFYPFLSRRIDHHHIYAKINLGSSVLGAFFLILISPYVIHVMLGDEFEKSIPVMQLMSISVVFLSMSYTYGTNYLIIKHLEKPLRNLTFVSSLIGMITAIPLVYYFSYNGAAFTVLICRGMLGIGSYILYKKYNYHT